MINLRFYDNEFVDYQTIPYKYGSNEDRNRVLRSFILKGELIEWLSNDEVV